MSKNNSVYQCWFCENSSDNYKMASGRPLAIKEGRETPLICECCVKKVLDANSLTFDRCEFCGAKDNTFPSKTSSIQICKACCQTAAGVFRNS